MKKIICICQRRYNNPSSSQACIALFFFWVHVTFLQFKKIDLGINVGSLASSHDPNKQKPKTPNNNNKLKRTRGYALLFNKKKTSRSSQT